MAMKSGNEHELCDMERAVREAIGKNAGQTRQPPFAGVAGRIAAGEPAESFERFFETDVSFVNPDSASANKAMRWGWTSVLGITAAAVLVLTLGGIMLSVLFGSSAVKSESAYDSAASANKYGLEENGAAFEDNCAEDCVSYSDLNGNDTDDSYSESSFPSGTVRK